MNMGRYKRSVKLARRHIPFKYTEAIKLNDYEIFITMLKFLMGIGLFFRSSLYLKYGVVNSAFCDFISVLMTAISNANLIKCMRLMPKHLVSPESKLTYGKVVSYLLDDRNERIAVMAHSNAMPEKSSFFRNLIDGQILLSCCLIYISYARYIND